MEKYSPTVSFAYRKDRDWWRKYAYAGLTGDDFVQYDPEGYDSYGYNENDVDRAGNNETDYIPNDSDHPEDDDYNWAYDADHAWGFDGIKPVLI